MTDDISYENRLAAIETGLSVLRPAASARSWGASCYRQLGTSLGLFQGAVEAQLTEMRAQLDRIEGLLGKLLP